MSYQGGGRLVLGGSPGELRKGDARIVYAGRKGVCRACGKPLGTPFIVQAKLPKATRDSLVAAAFAARVGQIAGPCMVGVISTWPSKWGKDGRAPGRPQGDVDAPLSNLLDALGAVKTKAGSEPGILYGDDAQVAVLVAINALGSKATARIEVAARPLSLRLLVALEEEFGIPFTAARLTLGTQEKLL